MRILVRFLKYLGWLALVLVLLFAVVVKFSGVESRFECSGQLSSKESSQPTTLWFALDRYRWWVGLWSDSDGNLKMEMPMTSGYYGHVEAIGHYLHIFDVDYSGGTRRVKRQGYFSTLSKALSLTTPAGEFQGTCKQID